MGLSGMCYVKYCNFFYIHKTYINEQQAKLDVCACAYGSDIRCWGHPHRAEQSAVCVYKLLAIVVRTKGTAHIDDFLI